MEKRPLGATGLQVTPLGFGSAVLAGYPTGSAPLDDRQAERLLNGVLDAGINFIDTAPDYGPSEAMIGRFLAHRRSEFILASKWGCNEPRPAGDERGHIWTGAQVRHNIEHSLRTLRTDTIDVWQGHNPRADELANSDVLETLLQIKAAGKVRHIGISMPGSAEEYGHRQLLPYLEPAWDSLETIQIWYSALVRYSEATLDQAGRRGKGVIVRGVMRAVDPWTSPGDALARLGLADLCGAGESEAQFLLRWALAHPGVHTAIVGTQSLAHLADNVRAAAAGPLPPDVLAESKRRLDLAGITA